ncbi:MAG: peptidylprolyl isomerase [Gammaproteobacteria bacterium]|nr:peptidylprolyl isomerase [Gammaproteobacteria bacterium]
MTGNIVLELNEEKAPETVANFMSYVRTASSTTPSSTVSSTAS